MNDIDIKLGADYTGAAAFKKAKNDVFSLEKGVKNLARTFGIAFGAQEVIQFGTQAVKAFANSERQTQQLTQSLTNLGLSLSSAPLDEYLQKLELAVGVTRDKLQPALINLLSVTGSISKSQKLLNTSLDIQASGLMDVQQAAEILSKAYVGNKKGLKELQLGLTSAELDILTFDQALALIEQKFGGQLNAKLNTTASDIERLGAAARQAKTLIGEGLANSFSDLAGNGDIDAATIKIVQFGQAVSNTLQTLAALMSGAFSGDLGGMVNNLLKIWSGKKTPASAANDTAMAQQQRKAEEAAAERAKKLGVLQAKAAKDQAALLKVQRAKSVFDLKKIQIEAALRGQISDEERKRLLELKKITEAELDAATKYNMLLNDTQKKVKDLIEESKKVKEIPNPYEPWKRATEDTRTPLEKIRDLTRELVSFVTNPFGYWYEKIFGINEKLKEILGKIDLMKIITNPFTDWYDKISKSNPILEGIRNVATTIAKIIENPFEPWRAVLNLAKIAIDWVLKLGKRIIEEINFNPFKAWSDAGSTINRTLDSILKNVIPNYKNINWNPFDGWASSAKTLLDRLKEIWNWIKKIDFNPFDKNKQVSYSGDVASIGSSANVMGASGNNQTVNINVSGAIDPYATANAVANALNLSATSIGSYNSLGISKSLVSYT